MKKIKLIINNDFKKKEREKFLLKELKCILNLYAKMVSNGTWKDYSFSSGNKEVSLIFIIELQKNHLLELLKTLSQIILMKNTLLKIQMVLL